MDDDGNEVHSESTLGVKEPVPTMKAAIEHPVPKFFDPLRQVVDPKGHMDLR